MKKKLSLNLILLIALSSCADPTKEKNATDGPTTSLSLHARDEHYWAIDPKESVVTWRGAMLVGANAHSGYVYLSKGEVRIENGRLIGGAAEVDMTTIEDHAHKSDNGLIKHLKDPDFFDVNKFPISTLVITKVDSIDRLNKKIIGNLTIKGITHPVKFPAKVQLGQETVKVEGKLIIDRTKWNVRYKSGKFYALVADQTMSDSIAFHIKILAKK